MLSQCRILLLSLIASVAPISAMAADIRSTPIQPGFGLIVVRGEIVSGDDARLQAELVHYERGAVLFDSPGGLLQAGLTMGELIRLKGFSSGVAPRAVCASACALAWLGGVERYMASESRIGFHAAYVMENGKAIEKGLPNALIGAYATRLGLPLKAVAFMTTENPDEMRWLGAQQANSFGIAVKVLDLGMPDSTVDRPAKPTVTADQAKWHFVSGLDPKGDNWLALKAAPNLNARRLAKLPPDTMLRLISNDGSWLNVRLQDGTSGYVDRKYVSCCK